MTKIKKRIQLSSAMHFTQTLLKKNNVLPGITYFIFIIVLLILDFIPNEFESN